MYWLDRTAMNQLRELNRMLHERENVFDSKADAHSSLYSFPKVNIWKNNNAVLVTAELPGIDPKEIDVDAHADKLVISGGLKGRDRIEGDAYQRSERSSGKFHREFTLPYRINPETVSASYKNGILRIKLGRAEEDKPKKISVTAS